VAHHQRERLLVAVLDLVAERGYRAVTVADVVKRARTARAKFYENFGSKQDCFLAAYERELRALEEAMAAARETAADSFAARVDAGFEALLAYLAANPAAARACLVEAPSVGEPIGDGRARVTELLAPLLADGREAAAGDPPANAEQAALDGIYWLLYQALLSGEPADPRQLRPDLVEFALVPFLGAEAATAHAKALD
jgi:AcrR family transcriptional regulator